MSEVTEKDFALVVLNEAQQIMGDKGKFLRKVKLNKLVSLVADKYGFDLTRGWYKFGLFSETIHDIIPIGRLNEIVLDSSSLKEAYQKFDRKDIYKIDTYIRNIRDQTRIYNTNLFLNWIYSNSPTEYRQLYGNHRKFLSHLNVLVKKPELEKVNENFKSIKCSYVFLKKLEKTLHFIDDDLIWDIFIQFTDTLNLLSVKIDSPKKFAAVFQEGNLNPFDLLNGVYLSSGNIINEEYNLLNLDEMEIEKGDIWTLLVPYSETVTGMNKDEMIDRHERRKEKIKPTVDEKMRKIYRTLDENKYLPTSEELKERLVKLKDKTSIERFLQAIGG
jgi:hypothetical protein